MFRNPVTKDIFFRQHRKNTIAVSWQIVAFKNANTLFKSNNNFKKQKSLINSSNLTLSYFIIDHYINFMSLMIQCTELNIRDHNTSIMKLFINMNYIYFTLFIWFYYRQ